MLHFKTQLSFLFFLNLALLAQAFFFEASAHAIHSPAFSLHQLVNDALIDDPIADHWRASSRGIGEFGAWIQRARVNTILQAQNQDGKILHENLLTPLTNKPVLIDDSPNSRRFFSGVGAEDGRGADRENSGPPKPRIGIKYVFYPTSVAPPTGDDSLDKPLFIYLVKDIPSRLKLLLN